MLYKGLHNVLTFLSYVHMNKKVNTKLKQFHLTIKNKQQVYFLPKHVYNENK